jgi:hypothetical protein
MGPPRQLCALDLNLGGGKNAQFVLFDQDEHTGPSAPLTPTGTFDRGQKIIVSRPIGQRLGVIERLLMRTLEVYHSDIFVSVQSSYLTVRVDAVHPCKSMQWARGSILNLKREN